MKPTDIRDLNFAQLEASLSPRRERVWRAWLAAGPRTTRELAKIYDMDILFVRPRTTELCQCGLVMLAGCIPAEPELGTSTQGIYRARTAAEWEAWAKEQRAQQTISHQMQLV
jgi:hypothetical protein